MKERKQWARSQGARLKKFLQTVGVDLPHKQCLEAVAAMNGVRNWQTFEATADADVVVHDERALRSLAATALQATLFESLPQGRTLDSLYAEVTEARAAQEAGAGWSQSKHRMNQIWEGVQERNLSVPLAQLPELIDPGTGRDSRALGALIAPRANPPAGAQEVFRRLMRDWRVGDGEEVPGTQART